MEGPNTISREVATLIAASPHPQLLLSPELVVVAASDAYLGLIERSQAEIIGRHIRFVLSGCPDLNVLVSSLEGACRTRRSQQMEKVLLGLLDDEGRERAIEAVNCPVPGDDGETRWVLHEARIVRSDAPNGSIAVLATEITLQAAEARLRSIMQTVPDAMIIIDEHGRIESLSNTAERLFGYSIDEVVGRNIKMFMPLPYRERHDGYLRRYLATGERHIIGIGRIVIGQRKDGSTFPMHLTIGELRSAGGHYFTGFIRDLTDQQSTESRLRELQSEVTHMSRFTALGEMASTLAHEINQPLTAINNYLKGCHRLLERSDAESGALLRDAIGKAAAQALRAGDIIHRLREFVARGDSERRVESLPRLIEDASTLGLIGAKENGVSVFFRLDPAADLVLVDRIQIQQVLVNLIRNAVEVMSEATGPRSLEIETVTSGEIFQISVADTGAGLAPDVAARLFQPFVTTKRKGMGLGLSICRTIVEAHGGRIWVEKRTGGGTIFKFTLRAANREAASIV